LLYRHEGNDVYGIVDRLIIGNEEIVLVDYKTHAQATPANMVRLAEPYFDQMLLYAKGVELLWPDTPLRALLLFTACKGTVEVLQPGSV
jgi:ATP-dependent helicase/nuclease subunit A